MEVFSLYIVDDEANIRTSMHHALKKLCCVKTFATAEDALKNMSKDFPDLILLDIGLPGIGGLEALKTIKKLSPNTLVIMITAQDEADTIVAAMKMGAYDYITKPFTINMIVTRVKNAFHSVKTKKEIQLLQQNYLKENVPCFIGESDSVQQIMKMISKVAQSRVPVIILGESGTGKELIARAIHYKSYDFQSPFIAINCAAIPENLLESELFGYEKGAFSGAAISGKKGQFELAENGTLFLDEIGDIDQAAQAKILRFIELGEFYRVGGTKKISIKTRIIAATNKDLLTMVENKKFREDLYYRLSLVKIQIPSLNERRDDILPITKHFLVQIAQSYGKVFTGVSAKVKEYLLSHTWKGNVRELKNLIERGIIFSDGPLLELEDLGLTTNTSKHPPAKKEQPEKYPPLPEEGINLEDLESHYIQEALKRFQGKDTEASKILGMNYYAFRYRKKKLQERQKH